MSEDNQDKTGKAKTNIGKSISELEDLITESNLLSKSYSGAPVLNDIVNPDEIERYARGKSSTTPKTTMNNIEDIPLERLNKLVDTVDQKLLGKLDSLVDTLKNTIKDSIINELKEELKKEANQIKSAPTSEVNISDRSSE